MTEAEWLASTDPAGMLLRLGAVSVRKQRLLCLACCFLSSDLLQNEDLQRALRIAESWIEGGTTLGERKNARRAATAAALAASHASLEEGLTFSDSAAFAVQRLLETQSPQVDIILFALAEARLKEAGARAHLSRLQRAAADQARAEAVEAEGRAQAVLVREIFGNPFRPVTFNPAWRTSDVTLLAQGIYAEKAFDRMPILADALQDAGCADEYILGHCRDTALTHVRGCWALDLVLGKE